MFAFGGLSSEWESRGDPYAAVHLTDVIGIFVLCGTANGALCAGRYNICHL